jgi:tetratricopeptide (TPR) repeat protein
LRAFFYTLVLTAVLIAAIIFLQSLPQPQKPLQVGRQAPMVVQSEPADLPTGDRDVAAMNRDALLQTGVELLDLWHVREAIGVLETAVRADSTDFEAYLKLIECYCHPTIMLESEAARCLRKARETSRGAGADTLWAAAIGQLYLDGRPGAAIVALKALDKMRVKNDEVLFHLGKAYAEVGDLAQAERHVGDLLDRDPSLGRAKELMIRIKADGGDRGDAERLARDLAATYPEEPYPYVVLSQVLLSRGKAREAAEFANNALRLDPRYIPAIVANANVHAATGELEAARVGFEKLLLYDRPMLSAFAMEGIACVEFLSGRFEQASGDMDDAIRLTMSAGSTVMGLRHAYRLIDCLCELGRSDMAETVLERWMTRSGEIPARLAQLRILIARGDVTSVRHGLERIRNAPEWRLWMRRLDVDFTSVYALSLIQEKDFAGALALIDAADPAGDSVGRRAYLTAYAHFEMGGAERAAELLATARTHAHRLEFPYHGDPVMYVQTVFFSAEAAFARGESQEAEQYYREFLDLWGSADWELQAVNRAREKLESLTSNPPAGDHQP